MSISRLKTKILSINKNAYPIKDVVSVDFDFIRPKDLKAPPVIELSWTTKDGERREAECFNMMSEPTRYTFVCQNGDIYTIDHDSHWETTES